MKILYVEDDRRDAELTVLRLLRKAPQLHLETVSTIERALARLDLLDSNPLDLVLTDVHLSDGDGLSLLKHIREHSLPVAVVVVTGMGDEDTAVEALKARADDYVVKRKDYLDRLPDTLESALNHYRADAARRSHQIRVLYAESDPEAADTSRVHFTVHADHIQFDTVSTGMEVLSAYNSRAGGPPAEVVLLNLHLPDMSGLEVLRELRVTLKCDVPVVMLCERGDEELAGQSLKLGASIFIVKSPGYLYQLPWQIEEAHSRAELLRRENALQQSEARNRAILNAIPDLMFLMDRDGVYLDYHAKASNLLLLPPEEFLGKKLSDVMPPDLASQFYECIEQASEQPVLIEYKLPMPDGERFFEASIVTCEGDKLLSTVRDITQRRHAEEALRGSEERLRLAQQAARVGTWEWDAQSGSAVWSDMIWRFLGLEPGDGATSFDRFLEFIHPEDRERMLEHINKVLAEGEEYYDEFRIVQKSGNEIWMSAQGRLIRSADGRAERMLGVNMDITERKKAETSLRTLLNEVQQLKDRLHEENIYLQEEIRGVSNFGEIVGHSTALRRVLNQAEQVAQLNTTVLVLGETGTGKELLAHAIHNNSPRREHRLVKVNCAALPAPLIESELFGHEKGAFTGADSKRLGRFALADGGTLFLDEVGELPLDLQAKLLRVLEEGAFEMVGSSRTISVNVRVIAATNRNLAQAVAAGTFRSDLYYRLSIFPIIMPPLRERREDIRPLVSHMVKELNQKLGKRIDAIPQGLFNKLESYDWPGNVRELRNVIERAVIITQGAKLQLVDSFDQVNTAAESAWQSGSELMDDNETLEQGEYKLILRTLKKVHWRVEGPGGAADLLGVHASTLRSRMKKLGISRPKVQTVSESV